jgi:signal transduction histidine kinase
MSGAPRRLVSRLIAIQIVAWGATGLLVVAFAPRLLLLEDAVVAGSAALALWAWAAIAIIVVVVTVFVGLRKKPLLRALSGTGGPVDPVQVQALYGVPARLATLDLVATLAVGAVTLVPPIRPEDNDLFTQIELVLLVMTMSSAMVLPAYVAMRASVARVLELVSPGVSGEAVRRLGDGLRVSRVRGRLLAAVVAPVAFVALGASLLAHAHLRAIDSLSRQNDAAELAEAVFDPVDGDVRGRDQAIVAALRLGLIVRVWPSEALFSVTRNDTGHTVVTVPLQDGHAVLEFATARITLWTGAYVALAFLATAVAWAFGHRMGHAFAEDVALATREIEATGVAEVVRGGRIRGDPRFESVQALMSAADGLGGVFREFARAQQRAIVARAATERTRGMFLASMSHDLKAPLNAILGFTELVSRENLSDGQRESVTIIEQRGRELLYLIETILDTARVEAGELTVSPEYTRVGDIVMPAVLGARELTASLNRQISGEIQPGVPRVLADPERMTQALTAITLVASRFSDDGQVVVRAGMPADGEQLHIDVEVIGRGMSKEDREKVFDAFEHFDHARKHGSLGLGPALARAIVELHRGSVAVSTTEAGGTVFRIWLPSERGIARESRPAPPPSARDS